MNVNGALRRSTVRDVKLIPAEETARRARAAIGYSGKEHEPIRAQTGISEATWKRLVAKTNPSAATIEQLWAIADACGVPRRFMEEGFRPLEADADERLAAIERRLDADAAASAEMRRQLAKLEAAQGRGASGPT